MSKELEGKLIDLIERIFENVENITEFSKRELKAISILSINPFMRRFFTSDPDKNLDYVDNKKHLNRKFEKTLITVLEHLSNALGVKELAKVLGGNNNENNSLKNLMKKM